MSKILKDDLLDLLERNKEELEGIQKQSKAIKKSIKEVKSLIREMDKQIKKWAQLNNKHAYSVSVPRRVNDLRLLSGSSFILVSLG